MMNSPPPAAALHFAVLGHPIMHSRSPRMHQANFAALGIKATYEALDVTVEQLAAQLDELQRRNFCGVNLTIPLKARALELVDDATPLARLLGGVNTISFLADGRRVGDNTDGYGFLAALQESGLAALAGRRVLVLGCGGTGRALALTSAQAGAVTILLANRTESRANDVLAALHLAFPKVRVQVVPADPTLWEQATQTCDVIIHTTSQGLKLNDTPLLLKSAFHPGQTLFDAVYTAQKTPIMREAEMGGAKTLNGLGMLLHQGAQSFRIWTGREPDLEAMRSACGV